MAFYNQCKKFLLQTHDRGLCQFFFDGAPGPRASLWLFTKFTILFTKIELLAIPVANQVEMYYCNPSQEKRQLMDTFTHKPEQFKHSDLIAQVENISLLTAAPSTSDTQAESASKSESKN